MPLRYVVGSALPFHETVEKELNPIPLIVSVIAFDPARINAGEIDVITGVAATAAPLTMVVAVAMLFDWTGSYVLDETTAVLSIEPGFRTVAVTWTVADVPLARVPKLQITSLVPLQLPIEAVAPW